MKISNFFYLFDFFQNFLSFSTFIDYLYLFDSFDFFRKFQIFLSFLTFHENFYLFRRFRLYIYISTFFDNFYFFRFYWPITTHFERFLTISTVFDFFDIPDQYNPWTIAHIWPIYPITRIPQNTETLMTLRLFEDFFNYTDLI